MEPRQNRETPSGASGTRFIAQLGIDDIEYSPETPSLNEDAVRPSKSQAKQWIKWWMIYALHFMFMWNTRTYEYASIVLVSFAFPKTLFATSIRGITSAVSSVLCASAVGSWIDRAPSRLPPLLATISFNHGAIIMAYFTWLMWPNMAGQEKSSEPQTSFSSLSEGFLFGFILLLDVIHDLSAVGNRLSLERDWVPVLVEPMTSDTTYGLTQVNAVMRRIDLVCKLVAPSLLPLLISTFNSRAPWMLLLAGVTAILWAVEIYCARLIAQDNPQLRDLKPRSPTSDGLNTGEYFQQIKPRLAIWPQKICFSLCNVPLVRLRQYFSTSVWPASISISILQMTVLAYSATLITYLLEVGFSLSTVTIARGSGSVMALAGTFITPMAVQYLRRRNDRQLSNNSGDLGQEEDDGDLNQDHDEGEGRIIRTVGFFGVSSQFLCMIPVVLVFWYLSPQSKTDNNSQAPHLIISLILFSFLSLSRIGHWMYDLMIQELEQVEILPSQRSTFAGTEQSFRSFFEMCHWAATVVWSRPEDFKWLALGSFAVLGVGASIFGVWSRKMGTARGHVNYVEIAMDDIGTP